VLGHRRAVRIQNGDVGHVSLPRPDDLREPDWRARSELGKRSVVPSHRPNSQYPSGRLFCLETENEGSMCIAVPILSPAESHDVVPDILIKLERCG
jgi:hypothetical protein